MTPLQAAKAHCANYQLDGSCLGIYYKDDLSVDHSRYRPCSKCLLADGKRCEYFEEIIVPMRMSRETTEAKVQADKKDAAVNQYLYIHNLIRSRNGAKKMCLTCRRVEVEGKQKYCCKCAGKRNRASYRQSKRRLRFCDVQKNQNSPIGTEALTKPPLKGRYHGSGHPNGGKLSVGKTEAIV
jgi:hypothetical protein